MLKHFSKLALAAIVFSALALNSCEKYEKVEENSAFTITAVATSATDASGKDCVSLDILLASGTVSGKCILDLAIADGSGASPGYTVYLQDGTELLPDSEWKFDKDGKMGFLITGLPHGSYKADISVRRWYHSASCSTEFVY